MSDQKYSNRCINRYDMVVNKKQPYWRIIMTGTVRLHRVFNAPPARVFKAFLDADAL